MSDDLSLPTPERADFAEWKILTEENADDPQDAALAEAVRRFAKKGIIDDIETAQIEGYRSTRYRFYLDEEYVTCPSRKQAIYFLSILRNAYLQVPNENL